MVSVVNYWHLGLLSGWIFQKAPAGDKQGFLNDEGLVSSSYKISNCLNILGIFNILDKAHLRESLACVVINFDQKR